MSIDDLLFNLRNIDSLNQKARNKVAAAARDIILKVAKVAENHDMLDWPHDWGVGDFTTVTDGVIKVAKVTHGLGKTANNTAKFICDCVNAVREANRPVNLEIDATTLEEQMLDALRVAEKAICVDCKCKYTTADSKPNCVGCMSLNKIKAAIKRAEESEVL